jgi:stringent starvation protein B
MFEPEDAYLSIDEEAVTDEPFGLTVATDNIEQEELEVHAESDTPEEPVRTKGRPSLRVVK